jgi:hypothetical protein
MRATTAAEKGYFRLSSGFDYSSGNYGDVVATDAWYIPLSLKYYRFPWSVQVTVPYLIITSPSGVIGAGESRTVVSNTRSTKRRTENGPGDIILKGNYIFESHGRLPDFDITGKIKFPTADSSRYLGTGEYDYSVIGTLSKLYGRFFPYASVGYKFRGDLPGLKLNNGWQVSLGNDYRINAKWHLGLTLDWREPSSKFSTDDAEAGAYLSYSLSRAWRVTAYGASGFTRSSPGKVLDLNISYRF